MGGFGAVSYAARFPDLFGAVASISGELDHNNPIAQILVGAAGLSPGASPSALPFGIWGTYQAQEVRWRGDNPVDLAINLTNTDILMCRGDGIPPAGTAPSLGSLSAYATEASFITQENESFNTQLNSLNIPHEYIVEAGGSHVTPLCFPPVYDWLDKQLAISTAPLPPPPTSFTYVSIKDDIQKYGWGVHLHRSALEFAALVVESQDKIAVTGSGTFDLTTPAAYAANVRYKVTIVDSTGSTEVRNVVADASGRLTLVGVVLGDSNPRQQYSLQAPASAFGDGTQTDAPFYTRGDGSRFFKTQISIGS